MQKTQEGYTLGEISNQGSHMAKATDFQYMTAIFSVFWWSTATFCLCSPPEISSLLGISSLQNIQSLLVNHVSAISTTRKPLILLYILACAKPCSLSTCLNYFWIFLYFTGLWFISYMCIFQIVRRDRHQSTAYPRHHSLTDSLVAQLAL